MKKENCWDPVIICYRDSFFFLEIKIENFKFLTNFIHFLTERLPIGQKVDTFAYLTLRH